MEPKRSLGQNFFANKSLAEKIVDYATASKPELIIEIGPGTGSFTNILETRCKKLICIEKDDIIATNLKLFYKMAEIIHEDILDSNIEAIIKNSGIPAEKTVIFGSLPYNISKPIIDKMLSTSQVPEQFYIIQKEVAQKYCAKTPDYNYLAVATQVLATPKMILDINPVSFRPQPKVMSTLIKFQLNPDKSVFSSLKEYQEFKSFLHLSFTKPNKTIKNNIGKDYSAKILPERTALLEKRPFALSKEELVELFHDIKNS